MPPRTRSIRPAPPAALGAHDVPYLARRHPFLTQLTIVAVCVVACAAAGGVAVQLFSYFAIVVVPVLLAVLLTGLLMPVQVLLNHRAKLPRHAAAGITIAGSVGAFLWLLFQAGNELIAGVNNLKGSVLTGIFELERMIYASPLPVGRTQVTELAAWASGWLRDNQNVVQQHAMSMGGSALSSLATTILVLVCTFFFLAQGDVLWCWVLNLAPQQYREKLFQASRRGWVTIGNYAKMQVVVSGVDAIGIGLGAYLLGLPFVVPLTVVVFFLCFIPIMGALLSGALVVLVALVTGGPTTALLMLLVVLVVQQLEGNVLCPYLLGKAVNLHPLVIILSVAAGTYALGLIGALFTVPVLAMVNSMGLYLRGIDLFPGLNSGGSALTDSARTLAGTPAPRTLPPRIGQARTACDEITPEELTP